MSGVAILGGSGGLGVAISEKLAQRTPVTIGYHGNREKAAELADRLSSAGGSVAVAQVDSRDGESVREFLAKSAGDWGGLDSIVCATGPAIPLCPLSEVTEDEFKRIYDTDVLGSFNVIKNGVETLARGGGGSIVFLLTTAVGRTLENDGMSGAPKTAVAALMRQAAREAGPSNVRLNGVAPGVIDAGIVHSSFQVSEVAKSVIESCLRQTPLGRMGAPSDIAAAVDFLASPAANYISGQILSVDGGYSA
jgi:NAD(P)-dependent dehydrogenase (short-subunit alcohol dehydrogenase family)